MTKIGIAIDIGTSGIRAFVLDIEAEKVLSGIRTGCHPIPGGNIIDQMLYASRFGGETAHQIMVTAINRLIYRLDLPTQPDIMAFSGNPVQLSFLCGTTTDDLLYSGSSSGKQGITSPDRRAATINAEAIGLDVSCDLLLPPAIMAEVGADAVALLHRTLERDDGPVMMTDFGTNAEMALVIDDMILVGSAAAGPALEGGHIRHGMLAGPGAVAGVKYDRGWRLKVLDDSMELSDGDTIDLRRGTLLRRGTADAVGITGTGLIALISLGCATGIIDPPRILTPERRMMITGGISLGEDDLLEAGKAIGAIRAGQLALAAHAGISIGEISVFHMAGTGGSYMDPFSARDLGLIPEGVETIVSHGNTSLGMACDLVLGRVHLDELQVIADRAVHLSFSTDNVFKEAFIRELAYWSEGAPRHIERSSSLPRIVKMNEEWAPGTFHSFEPTYHLTRKSRDSADYTAICPHRALKMSEDVYEIDLRRCRGASCLRCEDAGIEFGRPE